MAFEVHPEPTLAELRKELAYAREQLAKESKPPSAEGWAEVVADLEATIERKERGQ